jgi:general secretion pathway protein K
MTSSCGTGGEQAKGLPHKGSALLSVLWLSAALSLIAFTVATNVRGEIERTSTEVDSLRTYYLATAGIERALLYIQWGGKYFTPPTPILRFTFPSGETTVEIIPESSKFDINRATPQDLANLIQAVGAKPDQAAAIAAAIVDWRTPSAGGSFTDFDKYYLAQRPSFHARHASFEEIEELSLVRGMTPDLFHGRFEPNAEDRLVPVPGLKDCLSVYGAVSNFDANTASPALMRSIGLGPGSIAGILAYRAKQPIKSMADIASFSDGGPGFGRLGITVSPVCTLRSTAHLRLPNGQFSDVRRSVSALVGFLKPENNPPYAIMRWYDNAWSAQ